MEITGAIWPSRANAKYYIEGEDGRTAHLRSDEIDHLATGTRIRVTGTVDAVHYERPKDYFNEKGGVNYGASLPATFLYINVADFEVLPAQQLRRGNTDRGNP